MEGYLILIFIILLASFVVSLLSLHKSTETTITTEPTITTDPPSSVEYDRVQTDELVTGKILSLTGNPSVEIQTDLNMSMNNIQNIGDPVQDYDAVNKKYVDLLIPDPFNALEENFSRTIVHAILPFGGQVSSGIVTNPDITGVNLSEKCLKYVKGSASDFFAGFSMRPILNWNIGFNRVYVNIFVEDIDPPLTIQLKCATEGDAIVYLPQTQTTTRDAWETLVFDMSAAPPTDYTLMVFFPTFGQSNVSPDQTFYFGDISFGWVPLAAEVINPNSGTAGDTVTIVGYGFKDILTVKFGDVIATDIVPNADSIYLNFTCTVPVNTGRVPVSITLVDGTVTVIPVTEVGGGFLYNI
jgi:hypothetical protein